jgi:hypothetical protein
MTRDDITRMAREAGFVGFDGDNGSLRRFAALVAAHTLANIDPSKFMSYQEGYEAGRTAEREACKRAFDAYLLTSDPGPLRARGNDA